MIFQDGRLQGPLSYAGQGALETTQPVLLFALAFGLAIDYQRGRGREGGLARLSAR